MVSVLAILAMHDNEIGCATLTMHADLVVNAKQWYIGARIPVFSGEGS